MLMQRNSILPNNLARSFKTVVIALTLLSSSQIFAQDKKVIDIPTVSDARVFAEFKDKMPAVVN